MGAIQFIESMDRTSLTITDAEFDKNVEAAVSAIAERHRAANLSPTITQSGTFNSAGASSSSAAAGPASSAEGKQYPPRTTSLATEPPAEDSSVPMSGLFKTIQKPLSTIGRIFTDDAASPTDDEDDEGIPPPAPAKETKPQPPGARHALSAEEAAARQASAEAAEAQRLHRVEHASVVETLAGMFPDLDRDIISDVVHQKEGR